MSDESIAFDSAARSEIIDRLVIVLSVQLVFFPQPEPNGATAIEAMKGSINKKAIGYIYGFIDCALQCRGLDITDLSVGMPVLYHVLRNLFPGHQQKYVDFLLHHMEDETVVLGMMEGGQQYNDFLHNNGEPMGLAKFIFESRPV